jgi:predicted aconitase
VTQPAASAALARLRRHTDDSRRRAERLMFLTDDEKRMRDGAEGDAVAAAMDLLIRSSAVIYANSVLGARTNSEGIASTGAASLTGKVPCWGNHLDANRHGTHLISVRGRRSRASRTGGCSATSRAGSQARTTR